MSVLDLTKTVSLFEIIKKRRSVGRVAPEQPARWQIERLLESATYAPNHHKVEPWKFFVLTGKAREELGAVMAEGLAARLEEISSEKAFSMLNKERAKPLRAPTIITVAVEHPCHPWAREIENVEAVSAAVQNMLLIAEELGLACMWRTGDAAYDPHVKAWFGLAPHDHIVAFLYLGFPAIPHYEERVPSSFKTKTLWLGWEE